MKISSRRWIRYGAPLVGACFVAFAGVGLLHTSVGKPWLARLGGCPVGQVDPSVVQEGTEAAIVATRGTSLAPARPALGFRLDQESLASVKQWASSHGVECSDSRRDTVVKCRQVSVAALPDGAGASGTLDELVFGFRSSDGTLWSVAGWTYSDSGVRVAERMQVATSALRTTLGTPQAVDGSADMLARDESGAPSVRYRFEDYLVDIAGARVAGRVTFRQQYTSGSVVSSRLARR